MWMSTGRLLDPAARRPGDQIMGRARDVRHICFLNSTQKHIKLNLIGYSTLYSELW